MKNNIFFILSLLSICLITQSCGKEASFSDAPGNSSSTGVGGSMARFTVVGDYLYSLTENELIVFDLVNQTTAKQINKLRLDRGMETIFPFKGHLLLGSRTGMYIYNINNPTEPAFISKYEHIVSCDPVVAEGNYAYVTLRSGTSCRNGGNRLEVVDISNMKLPRMVKSYPMTNPHGLGVDNGTLFICDGTAGLKVLNASDPSKVHQIGKADSIKTLDVIPLNNVLMVIGESGLYQYDYTVPANLEFLSSIPIIR